MAIDFDRQTFLKDLDTAVNLVDDAAKLGADLAKKGVERIYFVGCGAPNRVMLTLQYWIEQASSTLEVRRYFPAEFITQNPARMDDKTLVVLGSKSGTTQETVDAAEFVKDKPCTTVGATQTADRPLAQAVQHQLLLGEGDEAHEGMFIVLLALVAGILKETDDWALADKVITSLKALPDALADAAEQNDARASEEARLYKDDYTLYEIASGPCFNTAYVFGVCVLMEMQWMHSYPIEAAEFFHGPFEILDQDTPVILMLGEDPSRPLMERTVRFCKKYTERLMIYDSKDFDMKGVDEDVRAIVAPMILQSALGRLSQKLAVWHNHPLTTRRYMWKTEY